MKYISFNELNYFSFHDAKIEEIDLCSGKMKWQVSEVNATIQNSQNSFQKDMCIEQAEMIFEDVQIEKIVLCAYRVYDANNNLIESVEEKIVSSDEYNDILRDTLNYIYSMEELPKIYGKNYRVRFNIDGGADIYDLTLSFSKSIVQWNNYCGIAWYEKKRARKNNL